ncbi:MAG TPA: hypothetical protein VG365_14010 [Solirubrobacteraceae bacterium]|jgi:hypothetical protein|nr:hypothetical protein [Solirubrobacteraceae bacterium]
MSRLVADGASASAVLAIAEPTVFNAAAQRLVAEIELWCPAFAGGELRPAGGEPPLPAAGERFAGRLAGVRVAGLGHPCTAGTLHATDRRALVLDEQSEPLREWAFGELAEVAALGNWGGLVLVHPGGETELVVAAGPEPPTWQDASGWLKVEAAFAAAAGRLQQWMAELPARLAVGDGA